MRAVCPKCPIPWRSGGTFDLTRSTGPGDQLLVGHDATDLRPGRTLESLYLDPLVQRVREHGGDVYSGHDEPLQLLVDIKNTGVATYTRIDQVLRQYRPILTQWSGGAVKERAVSVVISGDRPRALMEAQKVRLAAYDGRLTDLGSGAPASFVPAFLLAHDTEAQAAA